MYDRIVDVPRLTSSIPKGGPGHPVLKEIRTALADRFGERMDRIGVALYRDGRDSVAPHGDTIAREMHSSVMAIVSCGRSEEHTSELQSLMRRSYAVFCLKKKKKLH